MTLPTKITTRATLEKVRNEFDFADNAAYLNAASVGPLPKRTRAALDNYYEVTQRSPWKSDDKLNGAFDSVRKSSAELLHTDIDNVTYGYNTGFGMNIAAFGFPLEKGDEIVVSAKEFPANIYPWLALKERGVEVRFARHEGSAPTIEDFMRVVTPRTKLIAVSFVQFYNGAKLPLAKLSELAKSVDAYFVVDAIQGLGAEPLDFDKLEIDVLSAGAQKWLLSPLGIGLVAVSPRARSAMRPVMQSWLSVEWEDFFDLFQYDKPMYDGARKFTTGTAPAAHLIAFSESLRMLLEIGIENIQQHTHALLDRAIEKLQSDTRYEILSPLSEESRSSILSFTCADYLALFKRLQEESIICAQREGGIRIAPHCYSVDSDIDRLLSCL
jgi:selenocysteine lyase/cysteine desulfurase